jgi:hypothetical protein
MKEYNPGWLTFTVGVKLFDAGKICTVGVGEIPVAKYVQSFVSVATLKTPTKLIGLPKHTVSSKPAFGAIGGKTTTFVVAAVGTADGSAFVSATTDTVYLRCQGTGDLTVASVKSAAEGATGGGSGTFTVSIVAIFTPAK